VGLKRLLLEINKRSVWQVFLIYLGFAWVTYRVAQDIAARYDLPSVFDTVSLILLIVGLPIVITTGYFQEGIPPMGRSDPTLKVETDGDDDLHVVTRARDPKGIFTWQNAIMGGVTAFTIWAILAAGYLLLEGRLVSRTPPAQEPVEDVQN
jgi:hypothetical protein